MAPVLINRPSTYRKSLDKNSFYKYLILSLALICSEYLKFLIEVLEVCIFLNWSFAFSFVGRQFRFLAQIFRLKFFNLVHQFFHSGSKLISLDLNKARQ